MTAPDASPNQPASGFDEGQFQVLIDYLEQHRDQIYLAALRKQLIQAGHPPALVDETIRRVQPSAKARTGWALGTVVVTIIRQSRCASLAC